MYSQLGKIVLVFPGFFFFSKTIFVGVLAMGWPEIGGSEEEKREYFKIAKSQMQFFSKDFFELLAKPASEFGLSERKKRRDLKAIKTGRCKNLKNFSESDCNSALFL